MKKLVSVVSALALLLSCFSTVWAAEEEDLSEEFAKVRANVLESLLDMEYADFSEESQAMYDQRVANLVSQAQELTATMDASGTNAPWEDATDLGTNLSRLTTLAKAYAMEGSSLKGDKSLLDKIVAGCEFVYLNQYNDTVAKSGNWWNWEIGWAKQQVAIVAMIYDGLTAEQVERYLIGVRRFCPNPYMEKDETGYSGGANRVDICYSILIESALKEDAERLQESVTAAMEVLEYRDDLGSDGFYTDGSFLQHGDIAYNYSYGEVFMTGITKILDFVKGTSFSPTDDPLMENLYNIVYDAYDPLMYKGGGMDMTRGRAISRDYDGHQNGHTVLTALLRIVEFAPEPHATQIKTIFKYHVVNDTYRNFMATTNLRDRAQAQAIIDDESIPLREDPITNHVYNRMDRVSNFRTGWAAGLAMASSRIATYEGSNNENAKGWYQGFGTLYLYNNDLSHFDVGYWVTVDPYRYPGTTVDRQPRSDFSGTGSGTGQDWVGSTGLDDLYSVSGMQAAGYNNSSMLAKKSWFMFDDEIVCLGTDINCKDGVEVETTVENRKLNEQGDNTITVNGEAVLPELGQETALTDVQWAHLQGNVEGADIGYYFPETATLNAIRETRSANITDNNPTRTAKDYTNNFFTMWYNHGENPVDATYAYTILPGKSAEETQAYAENSGITILENSKEAQAVRDENLQVTGINFWNSRTKTVGDITCSSAASVMVKKTNAELEISLSDPTRKQTDIIELSMPDDGYTVESADEGVEVSFADGNVIFSIDPTDAKGKNFHARLVKTGSVDPEEIIASRIANSIVLLEGSSGAIVRGEKTVIDSADSSVVPFQSGNRVYVPLRFLAESLGATVTWDNDTQTATVSYAGTEMKVDTLGQTITVGETVQSATVFMRGDRVIVPVRLISEMLGKQVYWHTKGLIIVGDSSTVFNAATEADAIDTLIGQVLQ